MPYDLPLQNSFWMIQSVHSPSNLVELKMQKQQAKKTNKKNPTGKRTDGLNT